eukprot:g22219.t1
MLESKVDKQETGRTQQARRCMSYCFPKLRSQCHALAVHMGNAEFERAAEVSCLGPCAGALGEPVKTGCQQLRKLNETVIRNQP